jgi:hypothetical protein
MKASGSRSKGESRLKGRLRRLEVVERPIVEKPKLSIPEAIIIHLSDALSAIPKDYVSTPDTDRSQAIAVLGSVINLIEAIAPPSARRVMDPLQQLRSALRELNFGIVVPMLRHRKIGGRQHTVARVSLRGLASGVMSVLMKVGLSRKESGQKIAAVLEAKKFENVNWNTIAQWRDQVRSPSKRHRARDAYDLVISKELVAVEELRCQGPPSEAARTRYVKDILERFGQLVEETRLVNS